MPNEMLSPGGRARLLTTAPADGHVVEAIVVEQCAGRRAVRDVLGHEALEPETVERMADAVACTASVERTYRVVPRAHADAGVTA